MGEITSKSFSQQTIAFLLIASVFGTLLLPPMRFHSQLPAFELADLLFPSILFLAFTFHYKQIQTFLQKNLFLFVVFGLFLWVVVFSIVWNKRLHIVRDWFEVIKYFQFIGFLCFFSVFLSWKTLRTSFKWLFCTVLIFNFLHYFNVFDFNIHIQPFYAAEHHLNYFGLNSLGEPATKRSLGTLGNPNNNAFVFLLFVLLFLPKRKKIMNREVLFLTLAIFALFMCQSRTGFLAFVILLLVYFISMRSHWTTILSMLIIAVSSFFLLHVMGNFYLGSLSQAALLESSSIGRIEQWRKIIQALEGKWLFGNAPSKEYFQAQNIHAESGYFLILFRYGLLGVSAFLGFWFIWVRTYAFKLDSAYKPALYLFTCYIFSAITNTPLHAPKIALLLAAIMAYIIILPHDTKEANV